MSTRSDTADDIAHQRVSLGCGDHGCVIVDRGGMGTNGGCRCLESMTDPSDRVRVRTTFIYDRRKQYTPPKLGATKVIKGVLHVRVRETTLSFGQRLSVSRNGRPSYEWQPVYAPALGIVELRFS